MSCQCGRNIGIYQVFRWVDKFSEPLVCKHCKSEVASSVTLLILAIFQGIATAAAVSYAEEIHAFFIEHGLQVNEFFAVMGLITFTMVCLLLIAWVYVNLFPAKSTQRFSVNTGKLAPSLRLKAKPQYFRYGNKVPFFVVMIYRTVASALRKR